MIIGLFDFETGAVPAGMTTFAGYGGAATVQDSVVYGGDYALKLHTITASFANAQVGSLDLEQTYVRCRCRVESDSVDRATLLFAALDSTTAWKLYVTWVNGVIHAYGSDGVELTRVPATPTVFAEDQWFLLDIVVGTGANAAYEVWIGETHEFSGTSSTLLDTNTATVMFGSEGDAWTNGTLDLYLDDVGIADSPWVGTGTISGVVSDIESAAPISGATVSCPGQDDVTTGADGVYSFTGLTAGDYEITAAATGYNTATATATVVAAGTTTQDFHLVPLTPGTGTVSGTVTDGNGVPIAGATVSITVTVSTTEYSFEVNASNTTDANGDYTLTDIQAWPDPYSVHASATGYRTNSGSAVVVRNQTTDCDITLAHTVPVFQHHYGQMR